VEAEFTTSLALLFFLCSNKKGGVQLVLGSLRCMMTKNGRSRRIKTLIWATAIKNFSMIQGRGVIHSNKMHGF
jgi:hypothetical protein